MCTSKSSTGRGGGIVNCVRAEATQLLLKDMAEQDDKLDNLTYGVDECPLLDAKDICPQL